MKKTQIILMLVLGILLVLISSSLYIVDQRQNALIVQFGEPVAVRVQPGLKAKIPLIQDILYFDNRIQNLAADTKEVIAKDQKTMRVDAFTKYRIIDVLKFYQTVRDETKFKSRLDPILESSLRQVLGEVPFQDVLSPERKILMNKITALVDKQARSFGVEIVDVRIMRADLPEESRNAVYQRMRAEREKEAREIRAQGSEASKRIRAEAKKEEKIILAEAQRQSAVIRGEGDAEATRIFAESYNQDADFYEFYRSLDAYKASLSADTDTLLLSPDSKFLNYFQNYK